MSRCFPFPPPGYEKKAITEDIDSLKKEKRKEKKHKKDKKDKRDGKEKKDEKHKEKKEKKDKHRDKKKNKEKRKNGNLDDKKADSQFESYNGDDHNKEKDGSLGHKQRSVQFQNGEHREHIQKKEETCKESCGYLDDKKLGQNGEFPVWNRVKAEDNDNYKFVQELSRRIRDDQQGTCSRLDGQETLIQTLIDGAKKREKEKESDNKQKNKDREKQSQEKDRTKEDKVKEKTELKKAERDKNIYIKNSDAVASFSNLSAHYPNINIQRAGSELKKRKDTENNGFSHENEPRPNKKTRPASNILMENGRKIDFLQNPGLNISDKQGPSLGSFKVNNKEWRVNGITKPPIAAANHIACKPAPRKPPPSVPNNITTPPLPGSKKKPSTRPLHPQQDAKYLNQILTVPKLDQWSGLDDQEWLFNGKENPHFKKITRDDSLNEFHIWSEAKNLESIDLCALPYVIPY